MWVGVVGCVFGMIRAQRSSTFYLLVTDNIQGGRRQEVGEVHISS